jgi:Flp pilus assembly protein TadD
MSGPRAQLEQADHLRLLGQLDRAETLCHGLVRRYPDYVAALHTLGLIYLDKRNFARALDCLVRAQMLDPDNWMTLTALSLSYMRLGAGEMAVQTLRRALAIKPDQASIFASLGEIYRNNHDYKLAEDAYRKALKFDSGLESSKIGLALCLSALGRYTEAAGVLQDAFRQGHCSISLLDALAALPPKTVRINLLNELDLLAARVQPPDAEYKNKFAFARAAALHVAGRHLEAWQQLQAANRPLSVQHKSQLKEEMTRQENSVGRLRDASPRLVATGNNAVTLFILGASRSGKSSLEHLLCSLDGVSAGYEAPIVETPLRRTCQAAAFPPVGYLENLPSELHSLFRDYYLDELTRRTGSARLLTSTLSDRIYHSNVIASLIPNARFVLMRRRPQDNALRIYMSKYLRGNAYAYDLQSIATYLAWYDSMIDLFAEKYPEISTVVTYESMIADPIAVLHKVASLAGLRVNDSSKPELVDDRDVAKPYQRLMGDYWK